MSGPFGLDLSDKWKWSYYVKDSANPSLEQWEVALRIDTLADVLRAFPKTEQSQDIMGSLVDTFSSTLVQPFTPSLGIIKDPLNATEKMIFRSVVTKYYREKLVYPIVVTVTFLIVSAIVFYLFSQIDRAVGWNQQLPDTSTIMTFISVITGCLIGRLLYYGVSFAQYIKSMDVYYDREHELNYAMIGLLFDILTGFAACLLFITGLIVIAIGGEPKAGSNEVHAVITSLMIKDNGLLALAFGLLVD